MHPAARSCLICLALPSIPLSAGGFDPIPAEVWALRQNPDLVAEGAVVLEHRVRFMITYVEFTHRVRIMSEAGRTAAEFGAFSHDCHTFEGRTSYPDGREVTFNQRKDMAEKSIKSDAFEQTSTVLIPPGVTSDCVVELRWRESADPLPATWGWSATYHISHPYPTREFAIEVPARFPWGYSLFPARGQSPKTEWKGNMRVVTVQDIPARKPVPYCLEIARDFGRFVTYFSLPNLTMAARKGPTEFWDATIRTYYSELFDRGIRKGKRYRAFSERIREGLTGPTHDQARTLMTRLDAEIRNSTYPTSEEAATATKKEAQTSIDSQDLEAAVEHRRTGSQGMTLLFFHLLKDLGLSPKIALVSDRDRGLFAYTFPNAFQFDSYFMVLEDPGRDALWIEPGLRFAAPGLIHTDHQGTQALLLDPSNWSHKEVPVPVQPASYNTRRYAVDIVVEDEQDRFKVQGAFGGFPAWIERRSYMSMEPSEQVRSLKESFLEYSRRAAITQAEVFGAQDPKIPIAWQVEGTLEQEEARRREVNPFPGIPWALHVPDVWPETRVDPIVMPYLRTHEVVSTIHLPEGWKPASTLPMDRSNQFGQVSWSVQRVDDRTLRVILKITVTSFYAHAGAYEPLKTFLGWVREASGRTLMLDRSAS